MPRCLFSHNGTPTTKPGTDDDALRIALSQRLTAILIRQGNEKEGDYQVPGANGYTAAALAAAEIKFAHLQKEKPAVPENELQFQALALLRAGEKVDAICEELSVSQMRLRLWKQDEAFDAEWQEAAAEGQGKKIRSNPVRDAQIAQRAPLENSVLPPHLPVTTLVKSAPVAQTISTSDAALQAVALEKLVGGMSSADVLKETPGLGANKLALWRKNPAFKQKWESAKEAGNKIRDRTYTTKKAVEPPLPRRTVHQQAFADDQEARAAEPALTLQSAVNGPAHYGGRKVFDQMLLLFGKEAVISFCRLNIYKYNMRAGKKPGNSQEQDLSKADWYEQRLAELLAD